MLKVQSPSVYAPPGRSTNGSEMVVLPRYAQPSEPDGLEPHAAQQPPPRMHVVQEQREVRSWKDRGDRMEQTPESPCPHLYTTSPAARQTWRSAVYVTRAVPADGADAPTLALMPALPARVQPHNRELRRRNRRNQANVAFQKDCRDETRDRT